MGNDGRTTRRVGRKDRRLFEEYSKLKVIRRS